MQPATAPPRVLITAGPTHEPIDSVRYIANRSSGRMGLALAAAALKRNWPTTLLLGPTHLHPSEHSLLRTIRFQSTADLQNLLREQWPAHDVLLMAAAVADYRPARRSSNDKLRRGEQPMVLELEPTPDLLAEAALHSRPGQVVLGFALEPADTLMQSAGDKLKRKRLDAIVANPLQTMDSTHVSATVILANGTVLAPGNRQTKDEFGEWLLDRIPWKTALPTAP